jgi:transglutaminase-like putative cysteine protease
MAYVNGLQFFHQAQTLAALPDGPAGVRATLRAMAEFVRRGRIDPYVRQLALGVVRYLPGKDWAGEAEAVRAWVAANIRYVRDVRNVETVQSAPATLELRQGDCDDQAVLVGAMLSSIGADVRLVAIGSVPGEYEHVFCEVQVPGRGWLSAETTEPVRLGWEPGSVSRMVQNVA